MAYWRGKGTSPDLRKAIHYFKKAANFGLPKAIAALEVISLENLPVERRIGVASTGKGLLRKINRTCRPKLGNELSFIIRLLRLDRLKPMILPDAEDSKNKLMDAINIFGTPTVNALKMFPVLKESADFYLALGMNRPQEAKKFFKLGAQKGNIECELELMRLKVRQQKINAADFTPENDLKYADFPQYYTLKNAVFNNKAVEVDKLLEVRKKLDSYDNAFDAAVAVLYNFYTKDFRNSKSKLFLGQADGKKKSGYLIDKKGRRIKKINRNGIGLFCNSIVPVELLIKGNKKLELAAAKGNRDALYLLALQYLKGQRAGLSSKHGDNMLISKAKNLFRKATAKGHLKAILLI